MQKGPVVERLGSQLLLEVGRKARARGGHLDPRHPAHIDQTLMNM